MNFKMCNKCHSFYRCFFLTDRLLSTIGSKEKDKPFALNNNRNLIGQDARQDVKQDVLVYSPKT